MNYSNRYFIMRHGQSEANLQGIILSDPQAGCAGYGLTETGIQQALSSIQQNSDLDSNTLIFSSDFKRAVQTAEIIRKEIGSVAVNIDTRLRERRFGNFEGHSDSHYEEIWQQDRINPMNFLSDIEPVAEVEIRMFAVIEQIESEYNNRTILLVSHGDPLQILLTTCSSTHGQFHRDIPHLQTAEIRRLV